MSEQEIPSEAPKSGHPESPASRTRRTRLQRDPAASPEASPVVKAQEAPTAAVPMEEVDRHGFVSAFIGGVRPEGEQGRTGKRLLTIGAAVAVVAALGALAVGALGSAGGSAANAEASPSAVAAAASLSPSPMGGQGGSGKAAGTRQTGGFATGNSSTTTRRTPSSGTTGTTHASASPQPTATATAQAGNTGSGARTWSGVAGPGCSTDVSHFYTKDANYAQGTSGWLRSSVGGYAGNGCDGSYVSEPMSGSSSSYDTSEGVLWRFNFGSTLPTATCAVSVYIPANSDIRYVGGNPTHYYYWHEDYAYGMQNPPTGSFEIAQVSHRGSWVTEPAFKVTTGIVTVKMVNTGIDYTSSTKDAHHAAADVRLDCTGA